jgi:nucleoside phosphorylase
MLKDEHDFLQKKISEDTGISEQRLSVIKTISDEDFEDKVWASEFRRLNEFMDTHTRVCSKTRQRMTSGFVTSNDLYFANQEDLINWLRSLECSNPHISDQEYLEWCYNEGIYYYTSWYE